MSPAGVVLVVGASSGIGARLADRLESMGHGVVRASRWRDVPIPPDRARAWHVRLDARAVEDVVETVDRIEADFGPIATVLCAAGDFHTGSATSAAMAELDALVHANVGPFMNATVAVLPHMKGRGAGRLIAVGSGWTLMPSAGVAAYSAAKAALAAYVGCLNVEIEPYGVSAHVLYPGYVRDTGLAAKARAVGLREPTRLLWTGSRGLDRLSRRIVDGRLAPTVFANHLERLAPVAPVVSQRLFHRACKRLQPFPEYTR
jgi:NAD(P)-dependent dehydrogenase (short-subunit alcohol dehydrogenase family)